MKSKLILSIVFTVFWLVSCETTANVVHIQPAPDGNSTTANTTGHIQTATAGNSGSIGSLGHFTIPIGAELLESTEFRADGIPYLIERRYRLPSGEILWVYFDIEGDHSVAMQRIEEVPILAIGTEINISSMPGYREFNFGDDRRKLVQFMKIMRLGERDWRGRVPTPSLSDRIFGISSFRSEFILLLDLFDETWVLEHRQYGNSGLISHRTTAIVRVNQFDT